MSELVLSIGHVHAYIDPDCIELVGNLETKVYEYEDVRRLIIQPLEQLERITVNQRPGVQVVFRNCQYLPKIQIYNNDVVFEDYILIEKLTLYVPMDVRHLRTYDLKLVNTPFHANASTHWDRLSVWNCTEWNVNEVAGSSLETNSLALKGAPRLKFDYVYVEALCDQLIDLRSVYSKNVTLSQSWLWNPKIVLNRRCKLNEVDRCTACYTSKYFTLEKILPKLLMVTFVK